MRKWKVNLLITLLILILVGGVVGIITANNSGLTEEEFVQKLLKENEDNPESTKYLVTDEFISRVSPKTHIKDFKNNFIKDDEVKVFEDEECKKEVKNGYIYSGMYAKYMKNDRVFKISVIGDINSVDKGINNIKGDGILNQIELTRDIRHYVKTEGWKISEAQERESGDITYDNTVDDEDIKGIIEYIVYDNLEIPEVKRIESPKIEIIGGDIGLDEKYVGNVKLKITELNKEETEKTIYKITGSKIQEYIELDGKEQEIELSGEGIYKITAYTYGKLENKSKGVYELIKIGNGIKEYKVEHYKETLENGKYELVDTENLTGKINEEVEALPKKYIGFTYDEQNINNVKSGSLKMDKDLTLKLYYTRNEYKLTLDKDENVDSVIGDGVYKYEQKVTIDANLKKAIQEGYEIKWKMWESDNVELLQNQPEKKTTFKMPDGDLELIAKSTKEIGEFDYEVNYYFDNVKNEDLSYKDVAKYGTNITPELPNVANYEITKKENYPMTIGVGKNVSNIYYEIINYTIKYDLNGGKLKDEAKNPTKYNVKTPTFTLINPTKQGYTFTGWTGSNGKTPQDIVTIKIGTTGNKEYKANWKPLENTKYTVIHYTENLDGTYKEQSREELGAKTDSEVTAEQKSYQGFTYNEEKSNPIGIVKSDGSLVLNMYYSRNTYKLTLIAGDNILNVGLDGKSSETRLEKTLKYQEEVSILAKLKEQNGYTIKWSSWISSNEKILSNQEVRETVIGMPVGDITLTAKATKTVNKYNYVIEYYYDDIIDNDKTETTSANFGTVISNYTDKNIKGYELDKEKTGKVSLKIGTDITKNKIKIYYKQIKYNIDYRNIQNTTFTRENPSEYTVKTEDIVLQNPEKEGYTFLGWTGTDVPVKNLNVIISKGSIGNREYTAHFNAKDGIKYKVEHYTQNLDGENYTLYKEENELEAKMDDEVIATPISIKGFTFDEEKSKNTISGTILADGSLVLKVYYSRNSYNVTLKTSENVSSVITMGKSSEREVTVSYKYEEDVSIDATLKSEIGYTFNFDKWISENDNLGNQVNQNTEFTMPAGNVILRAEAVKTVNKYTYKIEYYYDDIKDDNKTEQKEESYNSTITTYPDKNIDGYELDEQKTGNINLSISDNESKNIIKVYYKVITYTINYNLVGGSLGTNENGEEITNPTTYTVKTEDIILNNPEKAGYTFEGWTGSNGDVPKVEVKIQKGSIGNKEYVANWIAKTDIGYKVQHYTEDLNGDSYSLQSEENFVGTMDTQVNAKPILIEGFTYDDIRSQVTKSGIIKPDGSLVLKLYYSRNSYKLKLVAGENINLVSINNKEESETEIENEFKYQQDVSINANLKQTEGYITIWQNWESNNENVLNDILDINSNIIMPASDIVLTAKATKEKDKFDYIVKYFYDGIEDENERITEKAEFESQITNYEDKVKDGYEFDKVESLPMIITTNPENNIINVYYKLVNYNIDYNLDGGSLGTDEEGNEITNASTYNIKSEDITLINPTKENFLFKGWTGGTTKENPGTTGNLTTETKDVTIKTGSMGDRTYIANWEELTYQVIVHHYLDKTGPEYGKEAVVLANDEIFTSHTLREEYNTDNLIPDYDENGNIINTDNREYIDGREYYVVNTPENATGEFTEETVEVYYYYQIYPVIRITSSPSESLNGTEYTSIKDALEALKNEGLDVTDDTSMLEVLRNIKDEAVNVENQNVQIDLKGFTINSSSESRPTMSLDNSKVSIIDTSELGTGKVISQKGTCVYIKADSEFTLGIDEKPVQQTPQIIGATKGIEKETLSDMQGIFNFFDGKIIASTAIDGQVDLTPLLYNATVTVNSDSKQEAILAIVSDAEARIGRKTYVLLEDAIEAANNTIGSDGSQVEITLIKDITKNKTVLVNENKNIKLDLAGHTITTTVKDYVLENAGDLEIVDSSANQENPEGTGKITNTTYDTIFNSYSIKGEYRDYIADDLQSKSAYPLIEENGKIVSNIAGQNTRLATSYAVIDLSNETGEFAVIVNAQISSEENGDIGYATISNSTTTPAYSNASGRFMYISGEKEARDYKTILQGGNIYYLHLGYYKNTRNHVGEDKLTINSVKLGKKENANLTIKSGKLQVEAQGIGNDTRKVIHNDGNVSILKANSKEDNILYKNDKYSFDYVDGILKSNNVRGTTTPARSYIEIDLTNKQGTHVVNVNAEITGNVNKNHGYAVIKETSAAPDYKDENGRFIYIAGNVNSKDYSVSIEGGKKYYLHLGYISDTSGNDKFTINSIKIDGQKLEFVNEISPYLNSTKLNSSIIEGTGNVILNNGRLNTEATTSTSGIKLSGNAEINGGYLSGMVNSIYLTSNAKEESVITINGATVNSANTAIRNEGNGKIVINDVCCVNGTLISNSDSTSGDIIVNNGVFNGATYRSKNSKVQINGGIFNQFTYNLGTSNELQINGGDFYNEICANNGASVININNGKFYSKISNNSTGNVNINGGYFNVVNNSVLYNGHNGTINIYHGEITSNNNVIENIGSNGTINIFGGNIYTSSTLTRYNCISNNTGTINIGNNSDEIHTDSPIINGGLTSGIYNLNGTVNYYDGTIKGQNEKAIYGHINEIPDNVEIICSYEGDNNILEVLTLGTQSKPIAKIGETTYLTLQSAIDACPDNTEDISTTIDILDNIYLSRANIISENKNIVLNLNGYKITNLSSDSGIENNGNLEIKNINESTLEDSSLEQDEGVLLSHSAPVITNNSNLNIGNISIEIITLGMNNNYKNGIKNTGNIEINGANIYTTRDNCSYIMLINNEGQGTITLNSGKISNLGTYGIGINNNSTEKVTINNGIVEGCIAIQNKNSGTIEIKSGNINGVNNTGNIACIYNENGNIIVENGSFYGTRSIIKTTKGNVNVKNGIFRGNSNSNGISIEGASTVIIDEADMELNANTIWNSNIEGNVTINGGKYYSTGNNLYNRGTIRLLGGEYKNKSYGIILQNNLGAKVYIENVIMSCNNQSYGIYNDGILDFVSGELINSNTSQNAKAIWNKQNGIVTLGVDDGNVSKTQPSIYGGDYGLYNENGTFNFYDGILNGRVNKAIYGTVTKQAEGYEIIKTEDSENARETAVLDLLPIARIVSTGEEYTTIQDAVNNCADNVKETIQILRNSLIIETTDSIQISENKDIILDINGYELSAGNKDTFVNKGNLEIRDTSELQTGLLKNTSYELFDNQENGNIEFSSGQITTTVTDYTLGDNKKYDCYIATNSGNGCITVNGATLTGMFGINNISTGEINVISGTINAKASLIRGIGINNASNGKITIEGGEIFGEKVAIYNNNIGEIHVNGGNLNGRTAIENNGTQDDSTGKIIINNGQLNVRESGGSVINMNNGYLEINDGKIGIDSKGIGIQTLNTANVVIKGGTFDNYVTCILNNANSSVKITDGKFSSASKLIDNYGTLEVLGGTFNNNTDTASLQFVSIRNNAGANAKFESCIINSYSHAILNNGTLTVNNETILNFKNDTGTGIINTGSLTFGNDDGTNLNNSVIINGSGIGVESKGTNCIFNYYDGKINAKEILKGEVNVPINNSIIIETQDNKYISTIGHVTGIVRNW